MKNLSSLLEVTRKGARGACHFGYSVASVFMCIGCESLHHSKGGLYICMTENPCSPNLLDELLKGFIVNPVDLPWKGVKRLATSDERVNHGSWVKMYNLCRVLNLVY